MLRIAIGSDHGGVDQKDEVVKYLKNKGYEVIDVLSLSSLWSSSG